MISRLSKGADITINIANKFAVGPVKKIAKISDGLINTSYYVQNTKGERFVLQKLHDIFKPSLLDDYDVITRHLAGRGFVTPCLVKTKNGALGLIKPGEYWRMLTFVPGRTLNRLTSPKQAQTAAALVGKFHNELGESDYSFQHRLPDFHDTKAKMEKLIATCEEFRDSKKYPILRPLADEVLKAYSRTDKITADLPRRIIHGDLKINNVRFDSTGQRAIALLDLDTVGRHSIVIDLGDAARTWCNRAQEWDARKTKFDPRYFRAMLKGYTDSARFVTREELEAIPVGIETIILELSARFVTDAFREQYFNLNATRYKDLFEQNLAHATAQLALYRDFISKKKDIIKLCKQLS